MSLSLNILFGVETKAFLLKMTFVDFGCTFYLIDFLSYFFIVL